MPTLLNRDGDVIADDWADPTPAADWTPEAAALLLGPDDEPSAEHASASRIAIEFPAFNDGRGLSTAVLLRTRLGATGELRAVGEVQPDVLHYMARCGFDSFLLPDSVDVATAQRLLMPYSANYQASVTEPTPHFRR